MNMEYCRLGKRFVIESRLERVKKPFFNPESRKINYLYSWVDTPISKPTMVVVVGMRRITDGIKDSNGHYHSTESKWALLVTAKIRSVPFYINIPA